MSVLKATIEELGYEEVLVADGLDEAAIGIVERCGQPPIVIYDRQTAIETMARQDGMTEEEAAEYIDFNCVGAWVGNGTPGWLMVRLSGGKVVDG